MNIHLHFYKETRAEEKCFHYSHMAEQCEGQEQKLCSLNCCLVLCMLCYVSWLRYIGITAVEHAY